MSDPVTHDTPIGPAMVLHPDTYFKLVSTIEQLNHQVENLEAKKEGLEKHIEVIEALRPHWAKGFSSASVAAQSYMNCTISMWEALGVSNQTEAMMKLKEMNDD